MFGPDELGGWGRGAGCSSCLRLADTDWTPAGHPSRGWPLYFIHSLSSQHSLWLRDSLRRLLKTPLLREMTWPWVRGTVTSRLFVVASLLSPPPSPSWPSGCPRGSRNALPAVSRGRRQGGGPWRLETGHGAAASRRGPGGHVPGPAKASVCPRSWSSSPGGGGGLPGEATLLPAAFWLKCPDGRERPAPRLEFPSLWPSAWPGAWERRAVPGAACEPPLCWFGVEGHRSPRPAASALRMGGASAVLRLQAGSGMQGLPLPRRRRGSQTTGFLGGGWRARDGSLADRFAVRPLWPRSPLARPASQCFQGWVGGLSRKPPQ